MLTLRYAVRNVFRHVQRSLVTLASISIGCIAIILAGGFFEDMYAKLSAIQINTQTGHIQIFRKGFFENEVADPNDALIENPERVGSLIESVPGVTFVAPRLSFSGMLSTGENSVSFQGLGLDPSKEPTVKAEVLATNKGALLLAGETLSEQSPNGILLGKGLAATFNARPNQDMILLTRTVDGSFNGQDVRVNGIFVSGMEEVDNYALRLPLATAQKLLRTDAVQSFIVKIDNPGNVPAVKANLLDLFQKEGLDLEVKTWDELSDFALKTEGLFRRFYFVLKLIIVFIVMFSIYNTLNMSIAERTAEIGTLMAMGFNRFRVVQLFLAEGTALGAIGGGIGVALGVLITFVAGAIGIVMPTPPGLTTPVLLQPQVILSNVTFSFSLSVACAFVSAFLPAFRASHNNIAESLRHAA